MKNKVKVITVGAVLMTGALLTTRLFATNLDQTLKDVCAALAPYQALACCGSSCKDVNKNGTQQDLENCIDDCKNYFKNG